jgi:hypothetical protein
MFTIAIDTASDAFNPEQAYEVNRILREVIVRLGNGYTDGPILDVNGNRVGAFRLTAD